MLPYGPYHAHIDLIESFLEPIIPIQSTKVDDDVPSSPPSKKIIVVTGGNGFFGAECVRHLLEHSDYEEIRVLDLAGQNLPKDPRVKFAKGTIVDLKDCLAVVEGAEAVLHIGAIVDLRYVTNSPFLSLVGAKQALEMQKQARH